MEDVNWLDVIEDKDVSPLSVRVAGVIYSIQRILEGEHEEEEEEHITEFLEDYQKILQYRLNILVNPSVEKMNLLALMEQEDTQFSKDIKNLVKLGYFL